VSMCPGGRSFLASCAALAAAVAVAGCGDGSAGRDEPRSRSEPLSPAVRTSPTAAAGELYDAFASKDFTRICALLTESAKKQAGRMGHGTPTRCMKDVPRALNMIEAGGGWKGSRRPRVIDADGRGGRRIVTLASEDGWRARIPFEKVGGRWRLDGFFGTTPAELRLAERRARRVPFPAGPSPARVTGAGKPCATVSTARFPRLTGGCLMRVSGEKVPVRILTPFGDFLFGECSISYAVRVDAEGRTWTSQFTTEGPEKSGCSDLNPCVVPGTYAYQPWKGRVTRQAGGGRLHRMDICMRTCVGQFVGELAMELDRTEGGWQVRPGSQGATGLRVDGALTVSADRLTL
jgi:hypothetical protein